MVYGEGEKLKECVMVKFEGHGQMIRKKEKRFGMEGISVG